MSSEDQTFNVTMNKFKGFCVKILEFNSLGTSANPIITRMNKFFKVYDLMEEDEKKELIFDCFYKPHKKELLQKEDDFSWLENKSVKLEIGKNSDRSMMCSSVYKKAIKIKKDAEKSLEGLPEEAAESMEELNYVDIYLLYFFRLLKHVVADEDDNKIITKKLRNIESDLGIVDKDPEVNKTGNNNPMNNLGGMLGNLGNSLQGMLNGNNKNGQNGQLNLGGLMKTVQNMVGPSNPELSKQLGETFGDLAEEKSLQGVLSKAVSKLGDPNLHQILQKGVSSITSNSGIENPLNGISESKSLPPISDAEISALQISGSNSASLQE